MARGPLPVSKASIRIAPYPAFNEEYFEWIDLLESVVAARKSFTMIELGAGTGRWAVRAAYAVRHYNQKLPFRLIAVEAEPTHFEWMHLHFTDNGIDPNQHSLIHAALSDTPGEASFYVGAECGDIAPDAWYGQVLTKDYEVDVLVEEAPYGKYQVRRHASGAKSITVPAITLVSILDGLPQVDLIDFDVQGLELSAIRSSIQELDAKVKRLHIGTHGREIETELRRLLTSHGWRCLTDYPCFSVEQTPWGPIEFQDGVQSWVNPRLSRPWWSLWPSSR
jgi:FkbM family methyltransferase